MPGASRCLTLCLPHVLWAAPVPWETCDDQKRDRWSPLWCVGVPDTREHTDYQMATNCHRSRQTVTDTLSSPTLLLCRWWHEPALRRANSTPPALVFLLH